jgi:type IV secretory pathway VirB3-like protein
MRTNLAFFSSMMIHFGNIVVVLFVSLNILLLNDQQCFHCFLFFVDGFNSQQGMGHKGGKQLL